jgi:KTSC domain
VNRVSVTSESIASIGYDERSQTLEVEFNHGGIYQYFDVPIHVQQELMNASSIGRYVAEQIKGTYRYARV